MVSAAVGCAFRLALADVQWVAAPLAMATAMLVMQWTRTVHPPGHLSCWSKLSNTVTACCIVVMTDQTYCTRGGGGGGGVPGGKGEVGLGVGFFVKMICR